MKRLIAAVVSMVGLMLFLISTLGMIVPYLFPIFGYDFSRFQLGVSAVIGIACAFLGQVLYKQWELQLSQSQNPEIMWWPLVLCGIFWSIWGINLYLEWDYNLGSFLMLLYPVYSALPFVTVFCVLVWLISFIRYRKYGKTTNVD